MHLSTIPICIAIAATLAACETPDPDAGRFVVNSARLTKLDTATLGEVRRSWSQDSLAKVKTSLATTQDQSWSLDFIATIESGGVAPCKDLKLVEIRTLEPRPFRGRTPDNKPLAFVPKGFLEEWVVLACSRQRIWRVFNESTDPSKPHRIILWSAA